MIGASQMPPPPKRTCTYAGCGRKHCASGLCKGHYKQARRGGGLRPLIADRDPGAHFWSRVDKTAGPDGCWPWMGGRNKDGYGTLQWVDRTVLAHRVAWELANGPVPPPPQGATTHGMCVLHHCDNPPCCNPGPDHLFLGTQAENVADKVAKGRQASGDRNGSHRLHRERMARATAPLVRPRGERSDNARLTEADVIAIRARHAAGETQASIAAAFGIDPSNISHIVRRKTWAHVA